ncbi:MAG: hypothetical protein AAGC63_13585 [Propionicimonas sp.]|nr:hypothetical protein [Propionicimonas sp.]
MGGADLTFTIGGGSAAAIRDAAATAGLSPADWLADVVARELAAGRGAAAGAGGAPPDPAAGGAPSGTPGSLDDPAAWHLVVDDTGSFQVSLPRGWDNRAWVVPTPAMKYPMVVTTDGATTLFSGDSDLPMFLDPGAGMFAPPPGTVVRPPVPAVQFLAEWVQYRHGSRPGFRVLGVTEDAGVADLTARGFARAGGQPGWVTGARLDAVFTEQGREIRAVFLAATVGMGPGWFAQVHGVLSPEDPAGFVPALLRLVGSAESTPAERERAQAERLASQAQHAATMQSIELNTAMMTAQHQQRMAGIQASAQAHQQGMAARQEAFDAGVVSWRGQQAASDQHHAATMAGLREGGPAAGGTAQQDFVNLVREERTVLDAHGDAHQVEAGADRYFHNEHTNTWVGIQQHQDIVEVTGGNRDDFQEGTIQS